MESLRARVSELFPEDVFLAPAFQRAERIQSHLSADFTQPFCVVNDPQSRVGSGGFHDRFCPLFCNQQLRFIPGELDEVAGSIRGKIYSVD